MPKQNLDLLDYFGPLAASIVFFSVIFVISVTCILWFCVSEKDDQTVFDKVFFNFKRGFLGFLGGIFSQKLFGSSKNETSPPYEFFNFQGPVSRFLVV
ncbi:unnamed protein product [Meloidogyne enterolobii]|uniref:Uncharacterized protein n=1 Tax=Meloidogyne enterolobii TaxID=390850 RepID=A0ACB1AHL1_MELEN